MEPGRSACPECGAIFHDGRWSQAAASIDAHARLCPACKRVRDKYPAGVVMIGGDFGACAPERVVRVGVRQPYQVGPRDYRLRTSAASDSDTSFTCTWLTRGRKRSRNRTGS